MEDGGIKKKTISPWGLALQVFAEISAYIAGPVIIAVIIGKMIDDKLASEPWGIIIMAIFGFFVSSYGIVKAVKKYAKQIIDSNNK